MTHSTGVEHFDVLIVGAGLSGIGAAYRLQERCPDRSYAVLEARERLGGTWDFFRYPGLRSDSDMYTLGYPFRPWKDARMIADGPAILNYIKETARENGIDRHIRFNSKVVNAAWSSEQGRWTLDIDRPEGRQRMTCQFLYFCAGYYRYDKAHQPAFANQEAFQGQVVHAQFWPDDLDYRDKSVVVVGSGATAVTLVPAMAGTARHVTMLQRSPAYILNMPSRDATADFIRRVLPEKLAHSTLRWLHAMVTLGLIKVCRAFPGWARRKFIGEVQKVLPQTFDIRHFTPRYQPWDQRMCFVPDGDLFQAIDKGQASVVTDEIARFDADGLELKSGAHLKADVVVTATGLTLQPCGGVALSVDGRPVAINECYFYKGMMLSGVPNLAWCVGYTTGSWTLRADLTSIYVCRLLNHMRRGGFTHGVPTPTTALQRRPLLDLKSGYIERAEAYLPRQGHRKPWFLRQNFLLDTLTTKWSRLADRDMIFATARPTSAPKVTLVPAPAE